MTSAIGSQSTSKSSQGIKTVDIRDFGAQANNPSFDNTLAIQRAHDSLLDSSGLSGLTNNKRGIVSIPSGDWYVASPVWFDGDHIHLRGEGLASKVISKTASPAFIFGKKRKENWNPSCIFARMPATFAPDHRFDLYGIWDSYSCPRAGLNWGLKTASPSSGAMQGDHYLMFLGTPPCTGQHDGWGNTQKLSIELGLVGPGGMGPIMGFGAKPDQGGPAPWLLQAGDNGYSDNKFHFFFRTQEGGVDGTGGNYIREISFGDTTVTTPQRIVLEIDFTTNDPVSGLCQIVAAINGNQVAVNRLSGTRLTTPTANEPSFTAANNLHFITNEIGFFMVAAAGDNSTALYGISGLTIFGLRIGVAPKYKNNGAGGVLQRLDSAAINDSVRYTNPGFDMATTVCYLPLNEPPGDTTKVSDRTVLVAHGNAVGGGYSNAIFQTDRQRYLVADDSVGDTRLYDLTITSADMTNGVALRVWLEYDFHAYTCAFIGGWWGINLMGGYDYIFENCLIFATDAWGMCQAVIAKFDNPIRQPAGTTAWRFDGANINIENFRMGPNNANGSPTQYYIKITGNSAFASEYRINAAGSDNEGNIYNPSRAFLYCEGHPTAVTLLELNNTEPGFIPPAIPMVDLVDRAALNGGGPALFSAKNLLPTAVGIRTNGPGWSGIVEANNEGPVWRVHTGTDGQSNLIVRHRLDALPTCGFWQANADEIIIRHPAPGGVRAYLCSTSGAAPWNATTAYGAGSLVWDSGSIYSCLTANTNSEPPNAKWVAIAAWNSATAYAYGNVVSYGGRIWAAINSNTNVTPVPGNPHWNLLGTAAQAMFAPISTLGTPVP